MIYLSHRPFAHTTVDMQIHCHARRDFAKSPEQVFALAIDSARFAPTFTGFGPIPAILAIHPDGPMRLGAVRSVHNSDGSLLSECTDALDPPHRHDYRLSGFRPPFSWLIASAQASWRISPLATGARVHWRYTFGLRSVLAWPVAKPLISVCMAAAMRRCLANMARLLDAEAPV
ncbi:MAG: SRPBCC family protein [Lysobacterales bacterium]